MPKLREAAVLAAMVGSVSMLGAGVATAHPESPGIACTQANSDTIEEGDVNLPALVTLTPGGTDADSRARQNNCGVDVEGNVNTSPDATGTDAAGVAE
ncbi:hypothetical protein AN219_17295 [Streptomyces nanshensis]|nr:hypothetical protein AN219_17295 [Streptomyces nanshensis]